MNKYRVVMAHGLDANVPDKAIDVVAESAIEAECIARRQLCWFGYKELKSCELLEVLG